MSNPKLIFSHLCDHATVSQEGKLSVIGIFKGISSGKIPYVHPLMILVFEINLEDTKNHNLKIEFKNPNGSNVKEPINFVDIKVDSDDINFGQILNIKNSTFDQQGIYKIILYIDNVLIGEEKLIFKLE